MTVLNYHTLKVWPPGAVRIMRPSLFGNPSRIGPDGNRAQVLAKYRVYLVSRCLSDPAFRQAVADLHGRPLVCCCTPRSCHGEDLQRMAAVLARAKENRP